MSLSEMKEAPEKEEVETIIEGNSAAPPPVNNVAVDVNGIKKVASTGRLLNDKGTADEGPKKVSSWLSLRSGQKSSGQKSSGQKNNQVASSSLASVVLSSTKKKSKQSSTPLFECVSAKYIKLESLMEFNEKKMYWRYKDQGGATAFHRLCANTSCTIKHLDICRDVLIELGIPQILDEKGATALHYAAQNPQATAEFILAVAQLWPDAIRIALTEKSEFSRDTPLHTACRSTIVSASILSALAQLDKEVCLFEDSIGNTPLAVLCHFLETGVNDNYGSSTLSSGLQSSRKRKSSTYSFDQDATKLERLMALGDLVPEAARCRNHKGQTALHLICETTSSIEAITYIGRLYPEAAMAQDYQVYEEAEEEAEEDNALDGNDISFSSHHEGDERKKGMENKKSSFSSILSKRKRRKSGFIRSRRMTKMFGNVQHLIASTPQYASKLNDAGATPLHYLCRRHTKIQPALLGTIGGLGRGATVIKTNQAGHTPLHLLFMNEQNANYANLKALIDLGPDAMEILDQKQRTPLDVCPAWLVDRLSPQLLALFPKKALSSIKSCNYCLLHYVCLKEPELVEAAIDHLYNLLEEKPPLAVYLIMPESSRERLASTTTIVGLVDKIFTAPSIVAYLLVEITLAFLFVISFFDMCIRLQEYQQRTKMQSVFIFEICIGTIHCVLLGTFKSLQGRALYRHGRLRHFFTIWNVNDILSIICFLATLISGLYDRQHSFRVIAAFSQLIIPFRLLRIVKGLNQNIGAFVLCLTNIVIGVAPFLFVFSLLIVSFSQVFHVLLSDFGVREATSIALDGSIYVENPFTSPLGSLYEVILIVLVGNFERDLFDNDLAAVLICLMLIVLVVVLLNVLIAVVSDTYERTLTNAEPIYLRSRLETATELQQVFPAWVFNPHETRILLIFGILFFPITLLWLFSLYLTKIFQGQRMASELAPRRLLAYAKARGHEDEEDTHNSSNARAPFDLLRRDLQTGLKKLQDEVFLRLLSLENEFKITIEHELAHALEIIDNELKELKTEKEYKDILTKQNVTLDRLINNMNNPMDHLPPDLRRRLNRERGIPDPDDDDDQDNFDFSVDQCTDNFDTSRFDCTR